MNALLHTPSYESSLSQAERLALCAGRFAPVILAPESVILDAKDLGTPVSRPRFPMPSMTAVREHDARLSLYGAPCNVAHDEEEEESDEESDLREFARAKRMDGMREHSLILPSQRGMREAYSEAYAYGYANE